MVLQEGFELRGNPFSGGAVDYTRAKADVTSPDALALLLGRHQEDYAHPELVILSREKGLVHLALEFVDQTDLSGNVVQLTDLEQLTHLTDSPSDQPQAFILFGSQGELYAFTLSPISADTYPAPSKAL